MTTLSKEDVVRMVKESKIYDWFWLRDNNIQEIDAVQNLLTIARADIVEVNKALVAENERLKDAQFKRLECEAEKRMKLRTALAAAEARETKLRDVIFSAQTTFDAYASIHNAKNPPDLEKASFNQSRSDMCSDALAQPRDESALREMIAEVYEECAKVCDEDSDKWTDYSCEIAARDCANKIRVLAEKAKGG